MRPSHGSAPISSSAALICFRRASSARSISASTEQDSAPVRMSDLVGPLAEQQAQRVDQDRFARAGLARERVEARPEFPGQVLDQRQVPDAQRNKHGRFWTGLTD